MKVEQTEKFQPIVITLENKDEAAAMWHILNKTPYDYDVEYYRAYGVKGSYINGIGWQLWKAVDPLIGDYASKLKGRFNEQPV